MQELHDNIWNYIDIAQHLCITTNLCWNQNNRAIMGAGIAKQALARYPDCNKVLGQALKTGISRPIPIAQDNKTTIWSFPTKNRFVTSVSQLLPQYKSVALPAPGWMGYSDLMLITSSANHIKHSTTGLVVLPRPGCGKGGLDWQIVREKLSTILDEDRFLIVS